VTVSTVNNTSANHLLQSAAAPFVPANSNLPNPTGTTAVLLQQGPIPNAVPTAAQGSQEYHRVGVVQVNGYPVVQAVPYVPLEGVVPANQHHILPANGQAGYYVQHVPHQMYVDHNGHPVYYRVG
jgi:hypothetical protein